MIEFEKGEGKRLKFEINIAGSKDKPEANFIIPLQENLKLCIQGKIKNGIVDIEVPPLGQYTEEKKSTMFLEIKVDGQYFTPWKEKVILNESVSVGAAIIEEKEVVEKVVEPDEISVSTTILKEDTIPEKKVVKKKVIIEEKDEDSWKKMFKQFSGD